MITMKIVCRRDMACQRWEVWVWDKADDAVVEWCDTYSELQDTIDRAMAKSRKFLQCTP